MHDDDETVETTCHCKDCEGLQNGEGLTQGIRFAEREDKRSRRRRRERILTQQFEAFVHSRLHGSRRLFRILLTRELARVDAPCFLLAAAPLQSGLQLHKRPPRVVQIVPHRTSHGLPLSGMCIILNRYKKQLIPDRLEKLGSLNFNENAPRPSPSRHGTNNV